MHQVTYHPVLESIAHGGGLPHLVANDINTVAAHPHLRGRMEHAVWVSRNHVYVVCDEVRQPVAVRYAFKDWVAGDLMHDGLPVSSFRSDNW